MKYLRKVYGIISIGLSICISGIAQSNQSCVETKLLASDGAADDLYGISVAVSASRVVVGSVFDDDLGSNSGSIYIYEDVDTAWIETKILSSDGAIDDQFGNAVDIEEDRIVVGAPFDDDNGSNSGSIYIYEWNDTSWVETKLNSSDGDAHDRFGNSISLSQNRVVVGAVFDEDNGTDSGSAYIYDWNGSTWAETKIAASDGEAYDRFGNSIAVSGDRIIVGAIDDDNGSNSGSIYIYEWNGTSWIETKLVSSDIAPGDVFGRDVDAMGDRIVVGADGADDNGSNSGCIYVYDWDGTNWVETKITASDGEADDFFGASVGLGFDKIVVGADSDDDNGSYSGSAYIYELIDGAWVETKVIPSDGEADEYFGEDVDVFNDRIIAGAFTDDDNGAFSGSAYIFECSGLNPGNLLEIGNSDLLISNSNFGLVIQSNNGSCFRLKVSESGVWTAIEVQCQ